MTLLQRNTGGNITYKDTTQHPRQLTQNSVTIMLKAVHSNFVPWKQNAAQYEQDLPTTLFQEEKNTPHVITALLCMQTGVQMY